MDHRPHIERDMNNLPAEAGSVNRVAIIGLAGRFPGSASVREFWAALERGATGLSQVQDSAEDVVGVRFALADKDCFDAAFFGFAPSEAALMDPQQRVFLETAWQAMEDAGYGAADGRLVTGVFAAAGFNDYVLKHVGPRSYADSAADYFAMLIGNDKDFLALRTAYLLDLKGPATVVQSACSSGLLCVHQAVQSLLQGEIDMALAGAVSISADIENGYHADPGGPMSPTGRIAPFCESANGIVGGNGVAALVLKRLDDAVDAGDHIYAVIEATAANNDGRERANFTAPGVSGQRRVLAEALSLSGLKSSDISYIEAHGTGTPIGDPIEMDAIKQVYGQSGVTCLIGSVKGNVGHLNTVAGLAGLIKAVQVVRTGAMSATVNFTSANPLLDLANSRFTICDRLMHLPASARRSAAVSSFGFGGTNVHVILSNHPVGNGRDEHVETEPAVLCWSARTPESLKAMDRNLAAFWGNGGSVPVTDDAGTLLIGRKTFDHRHAVVARTAEEAGRKIAGSQILRSLRTDPAAHQPLIFMFPGQGTQFAGMGDHLYATAPVYRETIDRCALILQPLLGQDIRSLLHGQSDDALKQTLLTQLCLFTTGYALAKALMQAGARPAALLGHSIGEYVAACLAGVFSLEDALRLVHARGILISSLPPAAMLSAQCGADELQSHLNSDLSLAVINRNDRCIVSGKEAPLAALAKRLEAHGIGTKRLEVSHGFHSHLIEPILEDFETACHGITFRTPSLPVLSNTSGEIADAATIATPDYWVRHLRQTVRFSDNVAYLARYWPGALCLELGPGTSCTAAIGSSTTQLKAIPAMVARQTQADDLATMLGQLWVDQHDINTSLFLSSSRIKRKPLPVYPFERVSHLLPRLDAPASRMSENRSEKLPLERWFHTPQWQSVAMGRVPLVIAARPVILFSNAPAVDFNAILVRSATRYSENADGSFDLRAAHAGDFGRLGDALKRRGISDALCVFGWLLDGAGNGRQRGHDSLVRLSQTLLHDGMVNDLVLLTETLATITGAERPDCDQALALGVLRAVPFEIPGVRATWLDCDRMPDRPMLDQIDHMRRSNSGLHALSLGARNGRLWQRRIEPVSLTENAGGGVVKQGGTYIIAGGTGGLGLQLALRLAARQCHIILLARTIDEAVLHDMSRHPVLAECLQRGARVTLTRGAAHDTSVLATIAAGLAADGVALDGIFNLAGRYVSQTLQDLTLDEADTNHAAKVLGSQALIDVFSPLSPGFLVNFSSLAGETSGYGNSDYMAANLYLDFLAGTQDSGFPVITIGWDNWEKLGTFDQSAGPASLFIGQSSLAIGLDDGFAALWQIMDSGHRHIIVTTSDLGRRLEATSNAALARFPRSAMGAELAVVADEGTPLERVVRLLFSEILGVASIGRLDDFLYAGGDSIMAVRLLSKLRRIFQVEFSLPDFLSNRTPALMAAKLETFPGTGRTALAYLHIQGLSPEEKQVLLRRAGNA